MPAFIATLGMQQAARGIALYYTNGQNILQLGDFVEIGQGMVGPIPVPVILVIVITVVIWYVVNQTRYGTRDLRDRRKQKRCGGQRNQFQEKHL